MDNLKRITWAEGKALYESGVSITCFVQSYKMDDAYGQVIGEEFTVPIPPTHRRWDEIFPLFIRTE